MATGGTEIVLGMHRDLLGTVVPLGMGGLPGELFKYRTMGLIPPPAFLAAKTRRKWPTN